MPSQIEQIIDSGMSIQKPLSLPHCIAASPPSLHHPGRLMRLLCTIIGITFCKVDGLGDQLPVSYSIATQLIDHDLSGIAAVTAQ